MSKQKNRINRIGLYGGIFDPVHNGHILPVQQAKRQLELDRVYYIPTAWPPHKPVGTLAPAHARYTMVELALLEREGMYASPAEMNIDRPTYTVESVEIFHQRYPDSRIFLILGKDAFLELPTRRSWRRIVKLVEIAVLERPGDEENQDLTEDLRAELDMSRVHSIRNSPCDVSSSEIRRALAADGRPPAKVMPKLVHDYVKKYGFYR